MMTSCSYAIISTDGSEPRNENLPTSSPFSTDSKRKLGAVRSSAATRRRYAKTGLR